MMLLILLLLASTYLVLAGLGLGRKRQFLSSALSPIGAAALTAAFGAATVLFYISRAPQLLEPIEVGWTGLSVSGSATHLQIGGKRQTAMVGWPTGYFLPLVEVSSSQGDSADLVIRGGGGFVKAAGGYLNGRVMREDTPLLIDNFSVTLENYCVFRKILVIQRDKTAPAAPDCLAKIWNSLKFWPHESSETGPDQPVAVVQLPHSGDQDQVFPIDTAV